MIDKHSKIRNCKVCEKEINVKTKTNRYSNTKNSFERRKRTFSYIYSDEGVLFSNHIWFCNSCWKKIIAKVKLVI